MKLYFSEQPILKDFDRFITYLCENPTLQLTNDKEVLKGPDAIALNELMTSFQTTLVTNKHPQRTFSLINTFFFIAKKADLFLVKVNPKNGKKQLTIREERVREYDKLSDDEKYFFLLEAFWCHIDWDEAYDCRSSWGHVNFYKTLSQKTVAQKITLSESELKREGELQSPMFYFIAEVFQAFGFFEMTWDDKLSVRPSKYIFPYQDITLLPLGKTMLNVLMEERQQYIWQSSENFGIFPFMFEEDDSDNEEDEKPKGRFEDVFLPYFEGMKIEKHLIKLTFEREFVAGNYHLKVTLAKDLYRTIAIGANATFDDLHYAIIDAFDFDDDHLYAFFLDGKRWSRSGESYWSPMHDDGISADDIKIGEGGLFEGKKFLYLFDFGDEWHFYITVESIMIDENELQEAIIIDSVGDNPKQYEYDEDEDYDDED